MTPEHGLNSHTVERIAEVFRRFPSVEEAVLFGSRAKGSHKPGSDIDLALTGKELDWRLLGKIDDALDDLFLPYCFSLLLHDEHTDAAIAAHIERVGRVFYTRQPGGAALEADGSSTPARTG